MGSHMSSSGDLITKRNIGQQMLENNQAPSQGGRTPTLVWHMSSSVIRFCSALQWDSGGTPSHSQFHLPPDPILITQASSVPIFLLTLTYHLPSPTLPMSFFTLMSLDYLTVSLKSLLRCTVLQQSTSSSPDKTTRSFFSAPSVSVMSLLLHSAHYRDAPLLNKCSGYMDSLM